MEKTKSMFAIYKFDFHKAEQRTIVAEAGGVDGERNVGVAQTCFASLFDENSIDNLVRMNHKREATRLHNDVLARVGDITIWRVNNSLIRDWWTMSGRDSRGIDNYVKMEVESTPYCNVLIDNRPGHCLMAIEKSEAWNNKPDVLRDMLLENLNRLLTDNFDLEMRIEARMNPTEIWEFVRERLYDHNDYIRRVTFEFQNPKKVNRTKSQEVRSSRLKSILRTVEISDALSGVFQMEFDKESNKKISQQNKDMAEMVELCGSNGYNISIMFKDFKTYHINDYVRAYFPMSHDVLKRFMEGSPNLDGTTDLENWFDEVEKQTRGYVNESEVPSRRKKVRG